MSEKLDGVRAYWDGKNLISRGGKIINAPQWFTQNFPSFELDGELWTKRNDFETIVSIVRDKTPQEGWKEIKYYLFEVPNAKGDLMMRLAKAKPYESAILHILPQIKVKNKAHLEQFLARLEAKRGEGVVVRDAEGDYINHRTSKALKVKTFHDAECEVIGYTEGKGKYTTKVGALRCKMDNGVIFKIGTGLSDALRADPPAIGTKITFKYQALTQYGKPRFPVFLRVRKRL